MSARRWPAAAILEGAEAIAVANIVLCELAWVLGRAYRYPSEEIDAAISRVVASRNVVADREAAETGLAMLRRGGDFADGIVECDAMRARCRQIATFDQLFARILDPERVILLG
jgi:predicted nucleic-acid-binding protein